MTGLAQGKDAIKFLEGLVVGDIAGIPDGQGSLSVFTNEQGGIIDDTVITKARSSGRSQQAHRTSRSRHAALISCMSLRQGFACMPVTISIECACIHILVSAGNEPPCGPHAKCVVVAQESDMLAPR